MTDCSSTEAARRTARTQERRALTALVLGATLIGLAPIWVRWSEVGFAATAFYRLALGLPCLLVWAGRERPRPVSAPSRGELGWALAAGICFAIDLTLWHASIRMTSVANATLLANFAPIFVTLGAWLFLRDRVNRIFFIGMALALVGAWLLTGASLATHPGRWLGDALALGTAIFYGGYQLCVARLRRSWSPGRVLLWSSCASTPVLAVFALSLGEDLVPRTLSGWGVLLGLALTAQVLGQGLITLGFARLPAGYLSLTLLVQPFVATYAGWWIFHERLDWSQAVGGMILIAGLYVARLRRGESSRPAEAPRNLQP